MYSVWRTPTREQRTPQNPRRRQRMTLPPMPAQAFHHLTPVFGDSTFINDTIRREHSPPLFSYE